MKQTILGGLAGLVVRFPTTVLASLLALAGGALYLSLGLSIDSNQLNLLDQELPAIKELHRIEKMTGGTGFLMLAIRGDEKVQLKAVADDLAGQLEARDNIRKVTYKQEISFVLDNIPMYIETADLDEARKRIKKKIRAEKRKQNPFAIELTETKEVELNFDDLIEKYKSMGKKGIDDDYYISPERPQLNGVYAGRYMILLLIKPTHAATDLEPTRVMIDDIHKLIARYNDTNTHGAKLQEGYGAALPADITTPYGFTGGYKLNLDDMET
ncbi:MAG: efflux RND transporter permease subunit, partial [Planctomycetota bacterium]